MSSISVVIRVKNERETLSELITILKRQSFSQYEVVIVDNDSKDGTYEFAKKISDKVVQISDKEFTHARSTNMGVDASSGKYIYFTNGHSLPIHNEMLSTGKKLLDNNRKTAGVYGRCYPHRGRDRANIYEKFAKLIDDLVWPKEYEIFGTYQIGMLQTQSAMVRGRLLRKTPLRELRTNGGEDALWAVEVMSMGYKNAYHPKMDVYHSHGGSNLDAIKRFAGYRVMRNEIYKQARELGFDKYI